MSCAGLGLAGLCFLKPNVARRSDTLVEAERANSFNAKQNGHFESHYYLTLVWMPPADQLDGVSRKMVDRGKSMETRNWHDALNQFRAQTARAFDLFSGFMPEIIMLDDEATLTYLHGTVGIGSQFLKHRSILMQSLRTHQSPGDLNPGSGLRICAHSLSLAFPI
jgi:hypothetical protein